MTPPLIFYATCGRCDETFNVSDAEEAFEPSNQINLTYWKKEGQLWVTDLNCPNCGDHHDMKVEVALPEN